MNYSTFVFTLSIILFGIKHFVSGLDIRKDSWLTDVEEQKNMISDDIRCFCNLPQCVSTGYMCRTARYGNNSGCFSEIAKTVVTIDSLSSINGGVSNTPSSVTRHGCIELLNVSHQRHRCDKNLTKLKLKLAQSKHHDNNINFLLLCCHEDMCNHIDNPENQKIKLDIGEHIDSSINIENSMHLSGNHQNLNDNDSSKLKNHSKLSSSLSSSLPSSSLLSSSSSSLSSATATSTTTIFSSLGHSNNDDWFRIATIAVPICGAVILFSLIAIAMKILRTDRSTSISLKLDNNHSSSLTTTTTTMNCNGGGGGTSSVIKDFNRKFIILDHEAQILKNHNNLQQQNQSSKLLEQYTINNYNKMNINNSNSIQCNSSSSSSSNNNDNNLCCDKKNETRAKINQLLNIQYSLLPQQSTITTPTTILPINLDDDNNDDNDDEDDAGELIKKNSLINDCNNYNNKLLLTNGNNNNNNIINNNNVIGNALLNSKLFYKNLNNLNSNNSCNNNNNNNNNNNFNCNTSLLLGTSNNTNNMLIDKHNKIYVKDILSPISENWISEDNNSDSITTTIATPTTITNVNESVQKLNNI